MSRRKGPSPGRNQRPAQALPTRANYPSKTPFEREDATKRCGEITELAFALQSRPPPLRRLPPLRRQRTLRRNPRLPPLPPSRPRPSHHLPRRPLPPAPNPRPSQSHLPTRRRPLPRQRPPPHPRTRRPLQTLRNRLHRRLRNPRRLLVHLPPPSHPRPDQPPPKPQKTPPPRPLRQLPRSLAPAPRTRRPGVRLNKFLARCHPERSNHFAKRSGCGVEGSLAPRSQPCPVRAFSSQTRGLLILTLILPVWVGHSCPTPLTLILILTLLLTLRCHPEEAESHAKRATPDEGPMQLACAARLPHPGSADLMPAPSPTARRKPRRTGQPQVKMVPTTESERAWPVGILTDDMKRVVREQRLGFVATVCPDGTPNLSPKGTTAAWGDDHLIFADIRSPGTISQPAP